MSALIPVTCGGESSNADCNQEAKAPGCCHQPSPCCVCPPSPGDTELVTQWLTKAGGGHMAPTVDGWVAGSGLWTAIFVTLL